MLWRGYEICLEIFLQFVSYCLPFFLVVYYVNACINNFVKFLVKLIVLLCLLFFVPMVSGEQRNSSRQFGGGMVRNLDDEVIEVS